MDFSDKTKVFKAVGPDVVVKEFIQSGVKIPDGWYASTSEALYNWKDGAIPVEPEKEAEAGTAPKRGRPRKV